ncbi:MAG: argininosuccinate lyase [Myxococcota bacterium]
MGESHQDTPARSLGGRFTESTDPLLERVNRSVEVDQRLWRQDISGSQAHAKMLVSVGLITADEGSAIHEGLASIAEEFARDAFVFLPSDEDIHMAVERRLGELIGEPARKLHTGRSRNDQVMTDTLLWLRDELGHLETELRTLTHAFVDAAERWAHLPMPSWTHSQPAQVSSAGNWMMAHAVEWLGHLERVRDLRRRLKWSPLGAGASAGTYLPIDRQHTAQALGFDAPAINAIAATGSRTQLLDTLGLLSLMGVGLSRLGEELVWMATPMLGWIRLPDRLTTGSSLLPQKKNPDGAELLRSGGKLAVSEFQGLASVLSALVSGYSKDLQHDKTLLFRAMDRTRDLLGLAARHVEAMEVQASALEAACTPDLAALWLADQLVLRGLAFREAHHLVGRVAREQSEGGLSMAEALVQVGLPPGCEGLAEELATMTPARLLSELATEGSAAPGRVAAQVHTVRQHLAAI